MKPFSFNHFFIFFLLILPVGTTMACTNKNVPVRIIGKNSASSLLSPEEQKLIIDAIRQQFLTEESAPCYSQVKIEILTDSTPDRKHYFVYLMHRDTYYVETMGITTDAQNRIIDIDETPFK